MHFQPQGTSKDCDGTVSASRPLLGCIAASPVTVDTCLPLGRSVSPSDTLPPHVPRCRRWTPGPLPRHLRLPSPVSTPPAGRHPARSGRTAHGNVGSRSAWHTSIAGAGVLALFLRGCWVFRPCPRAYLHAPAHSKQGPFPPAASHRLLRYYEPLGLPPDSQRFRSVPYTLGLCPTWAAREGLSCSPPFLHNVPPPIPRGRPTSTSDSVRCLLPSP
jgi:hypothetical protein